jgi:hypothetical protein
MLYFGGVSKVQHIYANNTYKIKRARSTDCISYMSNSSKSCPRAQAAAPNGDFRRKNKENIIIRTRNRLKQKLTDELSPIAVNMSDSTFWCLQLNIKYGSSCLLASTKS